MRCFAETMGQMMQRVVWRICLGLAFMTAISAAILSAQTPAQKQDLQKQDLQKNELQKNDPVKKDLPGAVSVDSSFGERPSANKANKPKAASAKPAATKAAN